MHAQNVSYFPSLPALAALLHDTPGSTTLDVPCLAPRMNLPNVNPAGTRPCPDAISPPLCAARGVTAWVLPRALLVPARPRGSHSASSSLGTSL